MRKIRDYIKAAILAVAVFSTSAQAGKLSEQLERYLTERTPGDFVRVIIQPASDFDASVLKTAVTTQYRTRAEQHRAGIERLKDAAAPSQSSIIDRLQAFEKSGHARNAKAFWVTNVIEAELTADALRDIASDKQIGLIDLYPDIVSIPYVAGSPAAQAAAGVERNVKAVKADSAWMIGYDGRGRIICSFDTGVDGLHPALAGNYRGNKGYPASSCWFSSIDSSNYPHVFSSAGDAASHGTHTTGIMVGHDDVSGDTIGVAPGADWIAAVAFDVPGASIFEAFQWAADPDGDPNTISDVPDVINHSWGIRNIGCAELFWNVIDNLETIGIVNIFAAGNEGSAPASLRNPANRAQDSFTNFAVGALDTTFVQAWSGSSRGPSDCDGASIKPNVAAPGVQIRSSVPGGYLPFAGTSGAAPHVSAAAAILRQKNPEATVYQIKAALLNSARDLGDIGPDNTFGWGIIDIMEALRQMDSIMEPSLQVENLPYPEINPGDFVQMPMTVKNIGAPVDNVAASFGNPDPGVTIITSSITFGFIDRDASVTGSPTLDLAFDDSLTVGRYYSLDMVLAGDGMYPQTRRLSFFVGRKGEWSYFHHDAGRVKFTISNYGAFGFHGYDDANAIIGSFTPLGFLGYKLDRDTNDLYEAALVLGVDSFHVSDCAKNIAQEPDHDFRVMPGGAIVSSSPGLYADQQTTSLFDDSQAESPMGLSIQQNSYGWASDPDNTFIILQYIITNAADSAINNIYAGLFFDWDIQGGAQNRGSYLAEENMGYLYWRGADSAHFRGVKILNDEGLHNHRVYFNPVEVYYSYFTEGRKFEGLTVPGSETFSTSTDVSHITSTGPFNLLPGQSDTASFGVIGGIDWTAFMASAASAEQKYGELLTDVDGGFVASLPEKLTLYQNRPNPFNPATTIAFTMTRAGNVRVEVFDILGRLIRRLYDGPFQAGNHKLIWDGYDKSGRPAPSGIYLYRVRSGDEIRTRKMILMK